MLWHQKAHPLCHQMTYPLRHQKSPLCRQKAHPLCHQMAPEPITLLNLSMIRLLVDLLSQTTRNNRQKK